MSSSKGIIVVALGGNAISNPNEEGNIDQQFQHSRETAELLCEAAARGYQLVITHGNGPQVGNVLRRAEIASGELYMIPLDICVADTQAGMGYMIGQCISNEMLKRGDEKHVATIVTSVVVDHNDSAFTNPTKPIGRYMNREDAQKHENEDGWIMKEVENGKYRRVVASPPPLEIVELPLIRSLVEDDSMVIACGGGGIPVIRDANGFLKGTPAVIDKDRTSSLLARNLGADLLIILTAVKYVYINWGKENQEAVTLMTAQQAMQYHKEGQFPPGSMGPKIEAAVDFVNNSSNSEATAIIAELSCFIEALNGNSGTRIVK